jgi:two-component system cell cycle response regulator DivK
VSVAHEPSDLIVEDNERNRKLFRLVVESMGCRTRLTNDGEEALQAIEAALPDLILTDIQMPNMDGMKLIGLLKAEERTRSIPVIAVTSFAMAGDRERLLEAGFVDYLSKPIDTEAMQQAITRHLGIDRGSDD